MIPISSDFALRMIGYFLTLPCLLVHRRHNSLRQFSQPSSFNFWLENKRLFLFHWFGAWYAETTLFAVSMAAVIDLESMTSLASMEVNVPVDIVTISKDAVFSALPSKIPTISALLTRKKTSSLCKFWKVSESSVLAEKLLDRSQWMNRIRNLWIKKLCSL